MRISRSCTHLPSWRRELRNSNGSRTQGVPFLQYRSSSVGMRKPLPCRTGMLMAFPFLFAGGLYNSPHSPVLEDGDFLRVLPAGNMEPLSPGGFWMLG